MHDGFTMTKEPKMLLTPLVSEHDHAQGPASALVTLVEYGDYHSVQCADAQVRIKDLQTQMGDRLRLVFRHFPVSSLHPHAAEAAEAAGLQNRFWEMHNSLFAHQAALNNGHLVEYALALGLDTDQFLRDMAGPVCAERVRLNRAGGTLSGVQNAPTFFVNGDRQPSSWKGDLAFMPGIPPTRTVGTSRGAEETGTEEIDE